MPALTFEETTSEEWPENHQEWWSQATKLASHLAKDRSDFQDLPEWEDRGCGDEIIPMIRNAMEMIPEPLTAEFLDVAAMLAQIRQETSDLTNKRARFRRFEELLARVDYEDFRSFVGGVERTELIRAVELWTELREYPHPELLRQAADHMFHGMTEFVIRLQELQVEPLTTRLLEAPGKEHARWFELQRKVRQLDGCGFLYEVSFGGDEHELVGPGRPPERPRGYGPPQREVLLPRVRKEGTSAEASGPKGISIRQAGVSAIWHALERPPHGHGETRERVATHVPEAFPELQDTRAKDTRGTDTQLRNELKNADRHYEANRG